MPAVPRAGLKKRESYGSSMKLYAASSQANVCKVILFSCLLAHAGAVWDTAVLHSTRGLKQNFAQFSPLQDTQGTYGGWGGRWELTPMPARAGTAAQSPPAGGTNGAMRRTTVRSLSNRPGIGNSGSNAASMVASTPSPASSGNLLAGSSGSDAVAGPGIINGGTNRRTDTTDLPRFIPFNGSFVGDNDVGYWSSLNPGSRVDATFLRNTSASNTTTLIDPEPIQTVRVPAAAFESGYCIPRQAYLVVNVTSRACYPGSNLTTWDGEPVCARLDCGWRARGTNVLFSATGCRTVVQRPQSICPAGCNLLEQLRFNTTVNRTQLVTRCSCKAGNQPCPSSWTACTCYEALLPRNVTRGFTVCSETQGECERKCNLAVSGTPRLAPLCPVILDPFLSVNATSAPQYPVFGWNVASQGSNTAALVAASGRNLLQLLSLRRRRALTGWQLAAGGDVLRTDDAQHAKTAAQQPVQHWAKIQMARKWVAEWVACYARMVGCWMRSGLASCRSLQVGVSQEV